MEIKTIGVVGAGQLGGGIAQVSAMAGYAVAMSDIEETVLDKSLDLVRASLEKLAQKGIVSANESEASLKRIVTTTDLGVMAEADFIIEAVPEDVALKKDVFRRLDEICRSEVILSSNTSSISITQLAASTRRPDRFVGMHFINPVPLMKLLEIIPGLSTSDETMNVSWTLSEKIGKTPVKAGDFPGFISNRILMPMINEAIYCLYEGIGRPEDIDQVMHLGMNHPKGPLATADMIGLDTCLAVMEVLHRGFGDDKYRPCPLLRKHVDAGRLGQKTGRGFYQY